jgi:hypothetical protein
LVGKSSVKLKIGLPSWTARVASLKMESSKDVSGGAFCIPAVAAEAGKAKHKDRLLNERRT